MPSSAATRSPLERGATILAFIAASDRPASLEALARALTVNKSSAYRLVETLCTAQLVARAPAGGYVLGKAALALGEAFKRQFAISGVCESSLLRLRDATGESAGAFVLDAPHRLCIATVDSRHEVRRILKAGQMQSVHLGAVGKVMLACMPAVLREECLRPLGASFTRAGKRMSRAELDAEIEAAGRNGHAVSIEETGPDLWGIAVPILDTGNLLGAFVVTGPMSRFPATIGPYVDVLRDEANAILTRP